MQCFNGSIRVKHGIRILFFIGVSICSLLGWFLFTPILYGHPANVKAHTITASGNSALAPARAFEPGVPANPSGLAAKTISHSQIHLAWTDNASNEEGFKIERKPSTAETYTLIATIGPNFEVFLDTGLVENTKYFYRIRAYNTDGHSNYSNIESGTTLPTSPKAPSHLTATTVSSTQINLAWQDNATNEDSFKIDRKIGDTGAYSQVAIVGANVTSYSSVTLNTNTGYSYRVRAYNAGGQSDYSNQASATTFPSPPAAPSNLTATTVSNTQINLAWQDNAINEEGFKIERKKGVAGTYVEIVPQGGIGANVKRFADSSLVASTLYFYRLRAFNTGNLTGYSNEANATTLPDKPAAPSNLTATTASHTQINLAWQDNATNEDSFKIERKIGAAGTYVKIAALGANVKNFSDKGLAANTEHFYRLRTANAGGHSDYSNEASTKTFPNPPAAPSNLTATTVSHTQINLAWQDNATNEEGFKIERKKGAAGTYVEIVPQGGIGANVKRFADSSLAANTLYFYRLRAFNTGNHTDYSNEANATTLPDKPAAPSQLTATTASHTQINLTWQDNATNEDSFKIERKIGALGKYVKVATLGANEKSFSDKGLAANTEHFYRLRAANAGGHSDYSNEASIKTFPNPPAAPSHLTATTVSHTQINLAWQDNATNEEGFKIERKKGAAGTYVQIVPQGGIGANVKRFADSSLAANTLYFYRLRAFNTGNLTGYSNEASATTLPDKPAAPSQLTATTVSHTQIDLTWQDNATNEDSFKIERKIGAAGRYVKIATLGANEKSFSDEGLTANTEHFYRLRAANAGGHSDYSNEASTKTFPNPPAAPSHLTATTVSDTRINLAWQDNAINEEGFKIERKKGLAGPYIEIVPQGGIGANVKQFADSSLTSNTLYFYRLRAFNTGNLTDYSNETSATTFPNPPAAPSHLTATTVSNTQINLAWQDNAINEEGFKIERKKGAAGTYVEIVPQGGIGANVKRFADSSLVSSILYFYRLRAFNTGNHTDYSNEASATTLPDKPAAPSNLTATTASHTQINLTWQDNATNEDSFKIERKIGAAGKYVKIATLGANVKSFSDEGLAANTEHFYRLRVANAGGQSDYSNEASTKTFPNPPAVPSNLTATTVSNSRINLAWQDNAINEAGFKIERKKGVAGTYVEIASAGANVKRFADSSLVSSTLYFYRLRAFNTGNLTGYSNEASATTLPDKPRAPGALMATTVSHTQINLTWQDNATNEDSFKIERKIGAAGTYVKIAALGANVKSFSDKGLAANTEHFYRLRTSNAGGQSDYSNEASTKTFPNPPAAPGNLAATTISNSRINLAWQDNAINEAGFKIERKKGVAGTYVEIASAGANVKRFADSSLVSSTLYFYRLRAFNIGNLTDYSNEASATTLPDKPAAPGNLMATTVSHTQIDLAWQDNATNEDSFKIERKVGGSAGSPNAAGTYVKIATLGANVKSFSDKGLASSTEHFYRLRAANTGGQSDYSNEARATTFPNPPAAPSNLTATMVSNSRINLAWQDNATNEEGFKIERKKGVAGTYVQIVPQGGIGANVQRFADSSLTSNTLYFYRLRAFNFGNQTAYSNEAGATTLPDKPAAPSHLTATTASHTQIDLAWQDNATNEDSFKIERKIGAAGKYVKFVTLGANVKSFSDKGLAVNTEHFYRLRAANAGGQSDYSNEARTTTFPNPPAAPSRLTATTISNTRINLAWQDNASNEDGFKIERKKGGAGTYAEIAIVGAEVQRFADSSLAANTLYFYRLRAFNTGNHTGYSNEASATTLPDKPAAPSNLTATTVSHTQIDLAWQDNATNEDSFKIERKIGAAGKYVKFVTLGANVKGFSDKGLATNTEHFYRLRAANAGGQSDYSTEASATTLPNPPGTPGQLTATAVSHSQINLAWVDSSNNEVGFKIERKIGGVEAYTEVAKIGANVRRYADNNLAGNTIYFYRIRAFNAGGHSDYSTQANATTLPNPPEAPGNLIATTVSFNRINLAWQDSSSDEAGFKIERKIGTEGKYEEIGSVAANATSYSNLGLNEITKYFYRVRAYNPGGPSGYSNVLEVTTLPFPPVTPGHLTTTSVSHNRINLMWADSSTNEAGFKIERKIGGVEAYAEVAKIGANVTSYSDNNLAGITTYFYRLRAFNAGGQSGYSNEVNATTLPRPPATPDNLIAITVSSDRINLTWQDKSTNEDSFKIERKTGAAGTYKQIVALGVDAKKFSDVALAANTEYFYRIRAYNKGGFSDYSNAASATTLPVTPAAPRNLIATTVSSTRLNLAWTDSANNEGGFEIERRLSTTKIYTKVATVVANVKSYSDNNLGANTAYFYRVRAFNAGGYSSYSNETSATTLPNPPATPGHLIATTVSNTQINLTWQDESTNEDSFKIERKIGAAGTYKQIVALGVDAKEFSDAALAAKTEYFYRLRAYNTSGASAYSNEANATTLPNPPVTPGQLTATTVSNARIDLVWQDKATDEDSFKIERKMGAAGKYAEVAKVGANVTSYSDNGLTENTRYFYRVRASNIGGPSNYSNEASATTPPNPPRTPGPLTASTVSHTQIDLAWQDQSTNEDSFKIERKTGAAGTYKQIAMLGANVNNFSDTGLAVNTGYFYRVRAYNPGGASAYSNEASAATLPNPPTSPDRLRAATISQGQINLAWADSSNNEVGFKIERKTLEGIYTQVAAVNANVASYADVGLEQDTEYFYRVRAYNSGGHSGYSNEASAITLPTAPAAPSRLKATAKSSNQIDLAWADSSNNEAGFKIERKTPQSGGTFAEIATVGVNVTSYSSLSLLANTKYFYRVRAYNIAGHSAYSNVAEAVTLPKPPAAPGGLVATPMPNLQIDLAWQDKSTNEDSFKIERKIGTAGKYVQIATVGQEVTSYSDSSLNPVTQYFYRVRAYNAGSHSGYSNEAKATTLIRPPAPPSGLTATPVSNTRIRLAWADSSNDESGFNIERKILQGAYVEIVTLGPNAESFTDSSGLSPNTEYFYRVRAFNIGGNSPYSNEVNATPSNSIHLALNKPALASSTEPRSAASQAVDGNLTTFWRSGTVSTTAPLAWLRVELNASTAVFINRVVIQWYQTYFATEYEIQVSNNGVSWTTVYINNAGATGTQEATFPQTSARYVRLYMKRISKASYRVTEFEVYNGVTKASHNAASEVRIPETVALAQNYPNPFSASGTFGNPSTTISYALPKGLHVTLKVINLAGQEVATLANGYQDRGIYRVTFNARKLPSGVYYAVLQAGEVTQMQRMVLAK